MVYRPVNKSHGKHMVGKVHSIQYLLKNSVGAKKREPIVA